MPGSPSLGVNLSYDPFAASRSVVRRAVGPEQPRIPNGFTELPGGNLMYAVADDPLKLYAQAAAEADARLASPRINNLDSPDRLYQELFAPLDAMYGRNQQFTPQRLFESANGVVAVDPVTLRSTPVVNYPGKPEPAITPLEMNKLKDLQSQRRQLMSDPQNPLNRSALEILNPQIDALEAELAQRSSRVTSAPQNSVAPKEPQVYFGGRKADPFEGATQTMTSGPLSLPSSEADLRDGQIYQTKRGPAKWNSKTRRFTN